MKPWAVVTSLLIANAPFSGAEQQRIPMPPKVEEQVNTHLKSRWFLTECTKTGRSFSQVFKGVTVYEIWLEVTPELRVSRFMGLYALVHENSPPKVFHEYNHLAAYAVTLYQGKLGSEKEIAELFGTIGKVDEVEPAGERSYRVYTRDLLEKVPALELLDKLDLRGVYHLTLTEEGKVLQCSPYGSISPK